MKTNTIVAFGTNAINIQSDIASFTVVQGGSQGNISNLKDNLIFTTPIITYEPDYWLLDGTYKFKPNAPSSADVGWWSVDLSEADRNLNLLPRLEINFGSAYSTNGLSIHFSELTGDYIDSLLVIYHDSGGGLIRSDLYAPATTVFNTNQPVNNFKKITIQMGRTKKAYRYGRITKIEFDDLTTFRGSEVKSASVTEQISPISVELPSNVLELTLYSDDGGFDITDPYGVYANLQYKQPLEVYEEMNGSTEYIGRFYLNHWESKSPNLATFKAFDIMSILDDIPYRFPVTSLVVFVDWPAGDIFEAILGSLNIKYTIDSAVASRIIGGYIPPVSTRMALQLLLFSSRSYINCTRSNIINIKDSEALYGIGSWTQILTEAEKGIESPVELKPLVTGVEIISHSYAANGIFPTIFSGSLPTGSHTIEFPDPHYLFTIASGSATITSYTGNTVVINVTVAGTIVITGGGFIDSTRMNSKYRVGLPAGTPDNIIRINDATMTMMTVANLTPVLDRVYNYYLYRYLQKTKLYGSTLKVGNTVKVNTLTGTVLSGYIEKMVTDLTGGFVSSTEIIGEIL